MVSLKEIFFSQNSRDEFKSSVVIDRYRRHLEDAIEDQERVLYGIRGIEILDNTYKGLKKSNIEKRKKVLLNNENFKKFDLEVFHNNKYFVHNMLIATEVSLKEVTFEISSTVYDLKARKIIGVGSIAFQTLPIHSLERFIQRANKNSIIDMLADITFSMKVNILFASYTNNDGDTPITRDVPTTTGIWMGDENRIKTYVDKDSLHNSDMCTLGATEKLKLEKAFYDYVIESAKTMSEDFNDELIIDFTGEQITSNLMKVIDRYDLGNYFTIWNKRKDEKRNLVNVGEGKKDSSNYVEYNANEIV